MRSLLLAVMILTYSWFLFIFRYFFRREGKIALQLKVISLLGLINMLGSLYFVWQRESVPDWQRVVALGLFTVALFLLDATLRANKARPLTLAYTPDSPQHLVNWGPYRFIRHPFYATYMLSWIAACVAAGSPLLWLPTLVLFYYYWDAARAEEKKFLQSALANEYQRYRNRTGMFFPNPKTLIHTE